MNRALLFLPILLAACAPAVPDDPLFPEWEDEQIEELRAINMGGPAEALPVLDMGAVDAAIADGDEAELRRAALAFAARLAKARLQGCAARTERGDWHIDDQADAEGIEARLREAVVAEAPLAPLYASLAPQHSEFAALRRAYRSEQDPARRLTLARNIERWRWLPRDLGTDFVLVNTAAFEIGLWRGGALAQSWVGVVGKRSTPTPVLNSTITHVNFNPWWEVPRSIVDESGGSMSARRGFVQVKGGRWRQRPGPGNSLGRMKLVMPNPHAIYLHDTPSQSHFRLASRAYSHGCVRVQDALGFAATLLGGSKRPADIERIVHGETEKERIARENAEARLPPEMRSKPGSREIKSQSVPLSVPLSVYIAYFTAGTRANGTFSFENDVYDRDGLIADPASRGGQCGNGKPPQGGSLRYTVEEDIAP